MEEILKTRTSTNLVLEEHVQTSQKVWEIPLMAIEKAELWSSNNDPLNQERLGPILSPTFGTAPVVSYGLGLSNEAVLVEVGLRLVFELCAPHQCHCGEIADPGGL